MGAILLFAWLIAPIVLGVLLVKKNAALKDIRQELSNKEMILAEYRKQNSALQQALRKARGGEAQAETAQTVANEETKSVAQVVANAESTPVEQSTTYAESTPAEQQAFYEGFKPIIEPAKPVKQPKPVKERTPISSGVVLFGLGILLVLTAGAIFATTTWNVLPAFGKIAVLLGAVAVFYGGAFVAEKKLELRNTSITFYILGSTFLAVINLAAGFFEWYGPDFTLTGEGSLLIWCISAFITAVCMVIGCAIYDTKVLGILGFDFILLSTILGSAYLFEDVVAVLATVGVVLILSQLFVRFFEERNDKDIIGTSLKFICYGYSIVTLCVAFAYYFDAETIDSVWPKISLWVMTLINLGLAVYVAKRKRTMFSIISVGLAIVALGAGDRFMSCFYRRMDISLFFFIAVYVVVLILKKRDIYDARIGKVLSVFIEATIGLVAIAQFFASSKYLGVIPGIVLALSAVAVYVLEHLRGDNKLALPATTAFYFAFLYVVDDLLFKDKYFALTAVVLWALAAAAIVAGRFLYKKVICVTEEGVMIDWMSIGSIIMLAYTIFILGEKDWISFTGALLIAAYFASFYGRVNAFAGKVFLSIATAWAVFIIGNQPFFKFPYEIEEEWWIALVLIGTGVGAFIWKEYHKLYNFVWVLVIAGCFAAEFEAIEGYTYGNTSPIRILKLVIYLMGMIALFVVSYIRKNKLLLIETGFIMVSFSILSWDFNTKGIFILAALCGVAYLVYLHMLQMSIWAFLPVTQIYILLFALRLPDPWWVVIFLVVMGAGLVLHRLWDIGGNRSFSDDIVNISGIVPVIMIWSIGEDKWTFCALMMLVMYILSFYRRYNDNPNDLINKGILTASSVVVALGWITQPWFEVSDTWKAEWIIIAFMATCLFNMLVVYKHCTDELWGWITFAVAMVCILIQAESAVTGGKVIDALVLGIVMIGVLIWAYMAKKKQWFILATVTLIAQCIYASREFWKRLAWWVYLLAAGAILIVIAARSEYKKRQGEEALPDDARHFFEDWSL